MQSSDDPPVIRQRWVPLSEAVVILGMPESTIRRLIRQDRLTGEQIPRDPGNLNDPRLVWRVRVPDLSPLVIDPPAPVAESESEHSSDTRQEPPQSRHDPRDVILLQQMDTIADLHERLLSSYQQIVEARAAEATAKADASHASARANDIARQLAESQTALARERAVSEANAAERDRERTAREAAEAKLQARRWWRFWE